jgi:hypothetical protein
MELGFKLPFCPETLLGSVKGHLGGSIQESRKDDGHFVWHARDGTYLIHIANVPLPRRQRPTNGVEGDPNCRLCFLWTHRHYIPNGDPVAYVFDMGLYPPCGFADVCSPHEYVISFAAFCKLFLPHLLTADVVPNHMNEFLTNPLKVTTIPIISILFILELSYYHSTIFCPSVTLTPVCMHNFMNILNGRRCDLGS